MSMSTSLSKKPPMRIAGTLALAFVLALAGATGCATHKPHPDGDAGGSQADGADSGVDISYVLGRTHRRLVLQTQDNQIVARSYLDRQILREAQIDRAKYVDFLKKAKNFADNPKRTPADQEPCRSPFTVTVRLGKDSKIVSGCRSSDEGALSHLVREGEFLLYSKK